MALLDHKDVTSSELMEKAAPLNGVNTAAQLIYQLVRVSQLSKVKTLFLEFWCWFRCMLAMASSCIGCFVNLVWYMLIFPLQLVCMSLTQNFRWYIIASIILFLSLHEFDHSLYDTLRYEHLLGPMQLSYKNTPFRYVF